MIDPDELSPALRGKGLSAQLLLVRAILDAGKTKRFPLGEDERKTLGQFVVELEKVRSVDRTLMMAVSKIVRQYEQHLIALTRSTR